MADASVSRTRNQHQHEQADGGKDGEEGIGRCMPRGEREKADQNEDAQPDWRPSLGSSISGPDRCTRVQTR